MSAQHTPGRLSTTPAWPMFTGPVFDSTGRLMASVATVPLAKFDALWCSEDNSVRVITKGREFFVSVNGDNFSGPHKSMGAARAYGAYFTKAAGSTS